MPQKTVKFDLRYNVILRKKRNKKKTKTVKKIQGILARKRWRRRKCKYNKLPTSVIKIMSLQKLFSNQRTCKLLQILKQFKLIGSTTAIKKIKQEPSKYRNKILRLLYANADSVIDGTDKLKTKIRIVNDTYVPPKGGNFGVNFFD